MNVTSFEWTAVVARIELLSWLAISNEVRAIGVFGVFYSTGEAETDEVQQLYIKSGWDVARK